MSKREYTLEQELILGGARADEARALAGLARRLPAMRQLPLVQTPPSLQWGRRAAGRRRLIRRSSRLAVLMGAVATGVVAASIVVVMAQMTVPGDALYAVKRASEAVGVRLSPGFHDEVMMRRADEVNQLVTRRANPQIITATLSSYDQTVGRNPAGSYAARDYCASMLKAAAAQANPATREQIMHSLSLLKLQES